jgi:hypothetical protein
VTVPRFLVHKVYQYSERVVVEAKDESAAKDAAQTMEGERIYDDHLYDCEIVKRLKDGEDDS